MHDRLILPNLCRRKPLLFTFLHFAGYTYRTKPIAISFHTHYEVSSNRNVWATDGVAVGFDLLNRTFPSTLMMKSESKILLRTAINFYRSDVH